MILHGEAGAPAGADRAAETEAAQAAAEVLAPLADALRRLWLLAGIRLERARLERESARRAWLGRVFGRVLCGAAATAGLVLAAIGARGGLHVLLADRPWLAEIASGTLYVVAAACGHLAVRAADRRAALRRIGARIGAAPAGERDGR